VSARKEKLTLPLAYQRAQAAMALGISTDAFDEHVKPNLKVVHVGDLRLYPVTGLQSWLDSKAGAVGGGARTL
jgi:hypothetical protein